MLAARIASAVVLVPVVGAVAILGGPVFVLTVVLAAVWCTIEYCRLLERGGFRPAWPLAVIGAAGLAIAPAAPNAHIGALALAALLLGPGLYFLAEGAPVERALYDWSLTALGAAIIGWPLGQAVALRMAEDEVILGGVQIERGATLVLAALTLTWLSDSFAYIVGRLIGRRPFFPAISPKKTREGAIAAVVFPAIGGLCWATVLDWPLVFAGILGASAGVAAVSGDLLESLLKRAVNAKDAGNLIPGHGGLLDRIDSLLLVLVTVALMTGEVWP